MPTILKDVPAVTPNDAVTREQLRMLLTAVRGANRTIGEQLNAAAIEAVIDKIHAEQVEQFGYLRRPTIGGLKNGFIGIVDISDPALTGIIDAVSLVIRGIAMGQIWAAKFD